MVETGNTVEVIRALNEGIKKYIGKKGKVQTIKQGLGITVLTTRLENGEVVGLCPGEVKIIKESE